MLALTSVTFKDYEKLRWNFIHILMGNCMETEFGLGAFLVSFVPSFHLKIGYITVQHVDALKQGMKGTKGDLKPIFRIPKLIL